MIWTLQVRGLQGVALLQRETISHRQQVFCLGFSEFKGWGRDLNLAPGFRFRLEIRNGMGIAADSVHRNPISYPTPRPM